MLGNLGFFVLLVLSKIIISVGDPIVQLPNGQIRGREDVTTDNKKIYIFQKVPYAAPPVGPLRFKAPKPAQDWEDILDATQLDVTCFQTSSSDTPYESEDCLIANIFTPELPTEDNPVSLPVMLYIHGGGFVEGASNWFSGDRFVNNDVILVTINYRVGPLGFLSTQDEVIPGNNGLKDQQFALKWTYENIHLFGGDPKRITIFGESAGSASVAYQLLNQNNRDLFVGAILQSGSCLSPWAFQRNARKIAFATAALLNSTFETSDDSQALLEFLQSVDAKDIDAASEQYGSSISGPQYLEITQGFFWAPVVEVKNSEAFLTKKMYGLLQAGNVVPVPIMIGINSEEGLSFNSNPDVLQYDMEQYDLNLAWLVPNDMAINNETERTEMGRLIRQVYTGGEPLANHVGDGVRYSSDTSFTRSVIKHAELFSNVASTYFYQFSYNGSLSGFDVYYEGAETVGHGEEISYIFCSGTSCDISWAPELDQLTSKRLVKLWTDFAKYQNPTRDTSDVLQNVTWPAVSTEDGNYFYLDINENLEVKNHPKEDTYARWTELYDSIGYSDFDTY